MPVLMPISSQRKTEILGADIAGGAGMAGERTAAESGDRGIEPCHAHFKPGISVGDRKAAGVVQMQSDVEVGPALAQRANRALDRKRRRPGHGVGEREVFERHAVLGRHVEDLLRQRNHARDRNIAFEIAAERRHDAAALDRNAGGLVHLDDRVLPGELLGGGAILIADGKFLGRAKLDGAGIGQPIGKSQRALKAFLVEPQRGVFDARSAA